MVAAKPEQEEGHNAALDEAHQLISILAHRTDTACKVLKETSHLADEAMRALQAALPDLHSSGNTTVAAALRSSRTNDADKQASALFEFRAWADSLGKLLNDVAKQESILGAVRSVREALTEPLNVPLPESESMGKSLVPTAGRRASVVKNETLLLAQASATGKKLSEAEAKKQLDGLQEELTKAVQGLRLHVVSSHTLTPALHLF